MDTLQLKMYILSSIEVTGIITDKEELQEFMDETFRWLMEEVEVKKEPEATQLKLAFDSNESPVN